MRISEHFTLDEFTESQMARRLGIDNTPGEKEIENLCSLTAEILEPLRFHLNRPIIVSSGFRCLALNRAIGSKDTSQHIKGQAADIKVHGVRPLDVCGVIHELDLPYDQLIHEFGGWTHVSIPDDRVPARKQRLTIDREGVRYGLVSAR